MHLSSKDMEIIGRGCALCELEVYVLGSQAIVLTSRTVSLSINIL